MKFKWFYLFLSLLFPIVLSFFLKFFGKSEFNIPVYFKEGVDSVQANCLFKYSKPYLVPDTILNKKKAGNFAWLITLDSGLETKKNFERVKEEINDSAFEFIQLDGAARNKEIAACVFFLRNPWTTVLVDSGRQIRGYYNPSTREETDRLIVEIKILLKQY